jgi:Uma2 family endonuclease
MTATVTSPAANASPLPVRAGPPVLEGIAWATYESLLRDVDASGQHVRITYDRGRMIIESDLVLEGISWATYESLLRDVDVAGQRVKISYFQGRMTIMSPLPVHETWKRLISWMIEFLALELNIPIRSLGSTTWRRQGASAGREADECYYVQNEPKVGGRLELDLLRDPPPDLALEVDVTHHPLDRDAIYAALRVPELWHYDGNHLNCLLLGSDGQYHPAANSVAFPFLRPGDLARFIRMLPAHNEMAMKQAFREWVKSDLASAAKKQ